jgi:putative transposase
MKKKAFTPEQIVRILREAETSKLSIAELSRKHGIADVTFYRWRRQYQGVSVREAKTLKALLDENVRLKRLLAERDLEVDALKAVLAKKD